MSEGDINSEYASMSVEQLRELLYRTADLAEAERICEILQEQREKELLDKVANIRSQPTSPNDKLLVEKLAIKMILGILRFTFVKIPSFIKDFFMKWHRTLLRPIRVLVLLSIWILMILAPLIFFSFNSNQERYAFEDIITLNQLSTGQILIVVIWGGLGIIGSIWGIFHITKTD